MKTLRVCVLALTAGLFQTIPAFAYLSVKISSINDHYDPNHVEILEVVPGENVSLSADLFTKYGEYYQPEEEYLENFRWSSSDSLNECDPEYPEACEIDTNFEVNDWGVTYYVPYGVRHDIRIRVFHKEHWSFDTLILRNKYANLDAPTGIVSGTSVYFQKYPHHNTIYAEYALAGQGRFIRIGGVKYFVPYHRRANWQPYQHGYWSVTVGIGTTWNSYETFGWYTSHFGYWRKHFVWGWVWCQFPPKQYFYHPHGVTFFTTSSYIGWYPYYHKYSSWAYKRGYDHGFRDGYWAGYWDGKSNHQHGLTSVSYNDFSRTNIVNHTQVTNITINQYNEARRGGRLHERPGANTREAAVRYMRRRVAHLTETPAEDVRRGDGKRIRVARRVHATPERYRGALRNEDRRLRGRKISVGAVVEESREGSGDERITHPNRTRRGLAVAPVQVERGEGGEVVSRRRVATRRRDGGRTADEVNSEHPRAEARRREAESSRRGSEARGGEAPGRSRARSGTRVREQERSRRSEQDRAQSPSRSRQDRSRGRGQRATPPSQRRSGADRGRVRQQPNGDSNQARRQEQQRRAQDAQRRRQADVERQRLERDRQARERAAQAERQRRAQAEQRRRAEAERQRRAQAEAQRRRQAEAQRRQRQEQARRQREARQRQQQQRQRQARPQQQRRQAQPQNRQQQRRNAQKPQQRRQRGRG